MSFGQHVRLGFLTLFFYIHALSALPSISQISPNQGSSDGGTSVLLTGTGFTGATAVNFGTTPASFIVNSDNSITAFSPPGTPRAVDISVTTPAGLSPLSQNTVFTYTGNWKAYVVDQLFAQVTVLDTVTDQLITTISTGITPVNLAITPDGQFAYVVDNTSNSVTIIDLALNQMVNTIVVGLTPFDVAITPNGSTAYITDSLANVLIAVDTATGLIGNSIAVGQNPEGVAITPNGLFAYVANFGSDDITPIDLTTQQSLTPISLASGAQPVNIAITPDGQLAFVVNSGNNSVTPINVINNTGGIPINVGLQPYGIAITPNGSIAYVTNKGDSTISVIDIASQTVIATIQAIAQPAGLAITPDGSHVYVADQGSSNVLIIDTVTNTVIDIIPVGFSPIAIAISPDQAPVASFTTTLATAGSTSFFDASNSISPVGTIVSYTWDFGDGNSVITSGPVVSHVYTVAGTYQVTLTVTNSAGTSTIQIFTGQTVSQNGNARATSTQSIQILPVTSPIPFISLIDPSAGPANGGNVVSILGDNFLNATAVFFGNTATSFVVISDQLILAIAPPGLPGSVHVTVVNSAGTSPLVSSDVYTYLATPLPLPPRHFVGRVVKNRFATKVEYVHELYWHASLDPNIVGYELRRNGHLIADFSAKKSGHFHYKDHNRKKKKQDVYTLTAVSSSQVQSVPETVILPISVPIDVPSSLSSN